MATDPEQSIVPPSQSRGGGNAPDDDEVARKGDWAGHAAEGIVPAPPADQSGVDPSAGDDAGAATNGGADLPDVKDLEPSKRDTALNAMQTVRDYAATKRG
jgi:hypothetical protein